jgi:Integrase core domain
MFKTECVDRDSHFLSGPLRTIDDVEYATMEWVDWFNNRRLHSQLDYVPAEEYEATHYAHPHASQPATPQPSSRHQTRNGSVVLLNPVMATQAMRPRAVPGRGPAS